MDKYDMPPYEFYINSTETMSDECWDVYSNSAYAKEQAERLRLRKQMREVAKET